MVDKKFELVESLNLRDAKTGNPNLVKRSSPRQWGDSKAPAATALS